MSVKTIFKVLIGTPLVMVIFAFIVEIYNVNMSGIQLNSVNKLAARQSCVLFSQESYKTRGSGGAANISDIIAPDGSVYASGKFYVNGNAEDIYADLYVHSAKADEFKDWLDSYVVTTGNWESINIIKKAINGDPSMSMEFPGWGADPNTMKRYSEGQMAKMYLDSLVTPLNMGVPYLDRETVQTMFRWELTQLLTNCNSANIHKDGSGKNFVMFKGFRVYANEAEILDFAYRVYDMNTSYGRQAFINEVDLDARYVDHIKDSRQVDSSLGIGWGATTDERLMICVVGVNYRVPVTYEGITPIQRIFQYAWSNEVEGYRGNGQITGSQSYTYDTQKIASGGFSGGGTSSLPVTGKLMYYIVR